ncbi:plastocyanin/azurin family copper-binding protein [Mesorhizobium sp. BAC0120]|uniref:plastocyanin/azurin family copper-binding protein n=1 Tax=Mesorhizobium sp. BAC0120 TaxID=3090670 RepID=UPI00298C8A03|nr:plastocyanin/azurin family copper-binding protein [Mesorhizobium sp. BAC0120]MDW6026064.1 plastocyanin/azurin family copper-binding protein [Mesorhizobium sp. BAC0120]
MKPATFIVWPARGSVLPAAVAIIIATIPARAGETVGVTLADQGMESMHMDLSTDHIKAGNVTFNVTNSSQNLVHEFVVVKSDTPIQAMKYNQDEKEVDESSLEVVNEIDDIDPGKSGTLTVKLEPGSYVLLCNKAAHYKLGMVNHITVTK